MEPWQKDFLQVIEDAAKEAEQFFDQVAAAVEEVVAEIDQTLVEMLDPLGDLYLGMEETIDTAAQPFVQTVQPVFQEHPVCVGCRHYHGQVYGGNLLVCAMHPYGWKGETCPDWQSTWEPSDRS